MLRAKVRNHFVERMLPGNLLEPSTRMDRKCGAPERQLRDDEGACFAAVLKVSKLLEAPARVRARSPVARPALFAALPTASNNLPPRAQGRIRIRVRMFISHKQACTK